MDDASRHVVVDGNIMFDEIRGRVMRRVIERFFFFLILDSNRSGRSIGFTMIFFLSFKTAVFHSGFCPTNLRSVLP